MLIMQSCIHFTDRKTLRCLKFSRIILSKNSDLSLTASTELYNLAKYSRHMSQISVSPYSITHFVGKLSTLTVGWSWNNLSKLFHVGAITKKSSTGVNPYLFLMFLAFWYSVFFNAIKSKYLLCLYSNRSCRLPHATTPVFYIGGTVIEFVNEWSHLGHVISTSSDDMHDIEFRKSSLIGQINGILCDFRNVTCNTKIRLIKTHCTSLYGAELWDLSNNYIDSICIAWWRGVRKVWHLPNATHSSLLPGISKTMPLIDLLYRRFLKFVYRCLSSRSFFVNL